MNKKLAFKINRTLKSSNHTTLKSILARLKISSSRNPQALTHHARGRTLSALGHDAQALEAHLCALEIDPKLAAARYSAGLILADQGREDEAIKHWEETLRLEPKHTDALYNLGQAMYNQGRFEAALKHWLAARALVPDDFEIAKKLVQAYNALGQPDDADRALEELVRLWGSSPNERVGALSDVIIDQIVVAGHRIFVHETLRPAHRDLWDVTSFRALNRDGKVILSVQLESGEYGREHGVPFVLSLRTARGYRVLEVAFASKPTYRQLKPLALEVLEQELNALPN